MNERLGSWKISADLLKPVFFLHSADVHCPRDNAGDLNLASVDWHSDDAGWQLLSLGWQMQRAQGGSCTAGSMAHMCFYRVSLSKPLWSVLGVRGRRTWQERSSEYSKDVLRNKKIVPPVQAHYNRLSNGDEACFLIVNFFKPWFEIISNL